jgi:hypothetical protein
MIMSLLDVFFDAVVKIPCFIHFGGRARSRSIDNFKRFPEKNRLPSVRDLDCDWTLPKNGEKKFQMLKSRSQRGTTLQEFPWGI